MSTRSRIGYYDLLTGQVRSVYCHCDGYLEYNGRILAERYTDPYQVMALISLGDISSLGETLEDTRDYHRWRDEPVRIHCDDSVELYGQNAFDAGEEYAYLYIGKIWMYTTDGINWGLVGQALRKEQS